MDDTSKKYFQRDVNATIMPAIFGRERMGSGKEHITISDPETNSILYNFFNKYHPPKPVKKTDDAFSAGDLKPKPKPKHSGNKLVYAKLYISEIKKYPKDKLSYEYAGMCMHLASFIEWDTGYLVIGYGKRKRYMERLDIAKALQVSESTIRRFVPKLEELKLIHFDTTGYKMIGKLFAKGREFDAD